MGHPFRDLQDRLTRGASTRGTVVELAGNSAVVATPYGVRSLSIPSGLQLKVGDPVRVESGNIAGRLRSETELPVYQV